MFVSPHNICKREETTIQIRKSIAAMQVVLAWSIITCIFVLSYIGESHCNLFVSPQNVCKLEEETNKIRKNFAAE